jgi:hypothetical protein
MAGLFGPVTEGAYKLSIEEELALKAKVFDYANSSDFIKRSGLRQQDVRKKIFNNLLTRAEFVGSTAGGAAGFLRLAGKPLNEENPLILRFALQLDNGPGNLFGAIPVRMAMRHELLHFVREAESLERRNVSLFEAEKSANIIGKVFLMLREEIAVWFRTLVW